MVFNCQVDEQQQWEEVHNLVNVMKFDDDWGYVNKDVKLCDYISLIYTHLCGIYISRPYHWTAFGNGTGTKVVTVWVPGLVHLDPQLASRYPSDQSSLLVPLSSSIGHIWLIM